MKTKLVILGFLFFLLGLLSCKKNQEIIISDNIELKNMVIKDQEMRQLDTLDMEPLDKKHRMKVMEMLAQGKVKTQKDKFNAALILQHTALTYCDQKLVSISPENYYLAYQLVKNSFEEGDTSVAMMVATTYDRYLLYTEGFQKYGTQRVYDESTDSFLWAPIDKTTTDQERAKYKIKPLLDLLKECKMKKN